MSKPYFTQYLSTDEDIKEGAKAIFNPETEKCLKNENGVADWAIKRGIEKGWKQGKLYLCTLNIHVNDEVERFDLDNYWGEYHKGKPVREIKPTEIGSLDNGKSLLILLGGSKEKNIAGNWFYMNEFFKKVGEISPEANWVREGHEFDKEDLCLYSKTGFYSGSYRHKLAFEENNNHFFYVGIKGTCKHFH